MQECVFAREECPSGGSCMPAIACLRLETFCSCAGETYFACRPDRPTASSGACTGFDAGTGGCRSNADCPTPSYCAGDGCGTSGTCMERPSVCGGIYSPVCGCDGRTYSNACFAQAVGVRVGSRGECD